MLLPMILVVQIVVQFALIIVCAGIVPNCHLNYDCSQRILWELFVSFIILAKFFLDSMFLGFPFEFWTPNQNGCNYCSMLSSMQVFKFHANICVKGNVMCKLFQRLFSVFSILIKELKCFFFNSWEKRASKGSYDQLYLFSFSFSFCYYNK